MPMIRKSMAQAEERRKVLLVEDDAGVRRSLQLLLQGRGFDVRAYAAGTSLLADPTAEHAACFVADYLMPGLDGLAVLRSLRARGWPGPAILITAYHSPDLAERAIAVGYDAVVEKPLREHALADMVLQLIHRLRE
jgi:FixJ family two-component response regulator